MKKDGRILGIREIFFTLVLGSVGCFQQKIVVDRRICWLNVSAIVDVCFLKSHIKQVSTIADDRFDICF